MACWRVPGVSILVVGVAKGANWVLAGPDAGAGVIPAVEVVLQAGGVVERAAGEAEELIDGGVGLAHEAAVVVVTAVIVDGGGVGGRVVAGQVAEGAKLVAERVLH